jgi:hypothetical protein
VIPRREVGTRNSHKTAWQQLGQFKDKTPAMVLSTTVCLQEIGGDDVVVIMVMVFSILRISQTCFTNINSTLQPRKLTLLAKKL